MRDRRNELTPRTAHPNRVNRRAFVRISGALGAGLVVAACSSPPPAAPTAAPAPPTAAPVTATSVAAPTSAPASAVAPTAAPAARPTTAPRVSLARRSAPTSVDAYLRVGPDGKITLLTGKVEFGQGIQTGFAQLAAEELDVPFASVNVVMGITNEVPYDLGTFGSLSTRTTGVVIRQAAAELHQWLVELGAGQLGLGVDQVLTKNGAVVARADPGKSVTYAALAAGKASNRPTRGTAPLKDPTQYTIVGTSIPRVDVPLKVNGQMKYGYDTIVPDMVHGRIVRPPSWNATLQSIDFSEAQKLPGVVGVFRDGDFAGLAAERHEQADTALAMVKATWQEQNSPYTSENIYDGLKATKDSGQALGPPIGNVDAVLAKATRKVSVTVRAPYIAHAQIEPMTALVHVQPDKTEVWTSTQSPFTIQDAVAGALNLPREQVIVYPQMSGGAFGRKNLPDAAIEAARLARALNRPVRVNWTRPDEFQFDHFRPAMLIELAAGLDDKGALVAWDWTSYAAAYFPEGATRPTSASAQASANVLDFYAIPNVRSTFYQGVAPLPPEHWRANGAPVNGLARESAIDELAELAGTDPVSFRAKLLAKQPRLLAVMHAAVQKSGWKPGKGATGQGFGLGLDFSDNTYVAEVAQVAVDKSTGKVKVKRVTAAIDCGLVVNPAAAAYQAEGAIVMQGTSSTLNEQITFAKGKVTNPSFAQYNPIGFLDVPTVDVSFVENKKQPMQGMGEPAVGAVSAAISNAIYDAVGIRMRDLPFLPDKVLAALKAKT